jgi:anhydro-N-acetylmuramic acid kinase
MRAECFAGVMSGTSLDGVDAVVATFGDGDRRCVLQGSAHLPFAPALRRELLALQAPGDDELVRAAHAANTLADLYADAIAAACADAGIPAGSLTAAGVHGQTVRHRPAEGLTIQLNNPARVAERAGLTVVADFRSRDVAAGGQGAPLVPAFHHAVFGDTGRHRAVLNLGGIANLTDLPPEGPVRGFDTGPGNVLLDLWHARNRGGPFDENGDWAATGRISETLLAALLDEPYFAAAPPKSTGRDLFTPEWLDARIARAGVASRPEDVQATLVALTARTIADAVERHMTDAAEVLVGGGGAHNRHMLASLRSSLAPRTVDTTAGAGIAVDHVEALAFAWLARQALAGRTGNLIAVTGARGPRVLGAIYPR